MLMQVKDRSDWPRAAGAGSEHPGKPGAKAAGGADCARRECWVLSDPEDSTDPPEPAQDEDALVHPSPCGGAAHAAPPVLRSGGALWPLR